jgi:hypothetical protein
VRSRALSLRTLFGDARFMLIVFELYVRPGFDKDSFLSEESRRETEARVLTREEAENAGLSGLPEPQHPGEVRYVLVNARHRRWVERAIDAAPEITGFNVHDVG